MCLVTQCPTLCHHMDPSVHGKLQARILEGVAIPFCRGFSWPRDQTQIFCTAGRFFTICATREAPILPYDPAIPQLGTYFEKTVIQEETRSPVFLTTALLTVARRWHQAKCPPTDEQMEMWYICVVEYHSATKRNKTVPLAETWLDLTEWSKSAKNKHCILTHM